MKDTIRKIITDSGHNMYQTHTWEGEPLNAGIRGVERRELIIMSDIRRKRILDLGCATGSESIWAYENGAQCAMGIDAGAQQILIFNKIIKVLEAFPKLLAMRYDLKTGLPEIPFQVDTLFCFSITHHTGYRKIWLDIPGVNVVYVEGGADSNYTVEKLTDDVFQAELRGMIPNNIGNMNADRPLFRLHRKNQRPQKHYWQMLTKMSNECFTGQCALTGEVKIIKPLTDRFDEILPIAANEYINYKLMMLLAAKGIDIDVAEVRLEKSVQNNLGHNVCLIEYMGEHSRINVDKKYENQFPEWLYWFDRWIGRLDGETNLILVGTKIISIDFAMCFHWVVGDERNMHDINMLNVKCHPQVKEARSAVSKTVIQAIEDKEIEDIVLADELEGFVSITIRREYVKGLKWRRDHLK